MSAYIEPHELSRLQAFLNGDDPDVLLTDIPDRCCRLADAVRHKAIEEARKAVSARRTLEAKLERVRAVKENDFLEGRFNEANRDSLEVAYAIKHVANSANIFIKKSMLNLILYDVYANWIYSQKEVLTTEEPRAIESGPIFWRVYKRIDMAAPTSETRKYADSLAAFNPGVLALIRNVVRKYADIDERRMEALMKNNEAYRNANRTHNNGKWNKVIEPKDIYLWKKKAAGK